MLRVENKNCHAVLKSDEANERLQQFNALLAAGKITSLVDALPLLLNLKGKPYTLANHFPFENLFRFDVPDMQLYKTARQVAKTTTSSADVIIKSNSISNFTTLCIMPLFEQARRMSAMFVAPFIHQSPVKQLWTDTTTVNSVLHRSFTTQSQILFSFAYLDAERVRGVFCDRLCFDEIQDINRAHLPIINECITASPWALKQYTGTPKTLDNTIEVLWEQTTMAEWFIPCMHCTENGFPTWNIPSMEFHLERMIGPWHRDISEKYPAVVCHKCGQSISPRLGRWVHRRPQRLGYFNGYHIPQIIMPLHYSSPSKWAELLNKQQGKGNTPTNVFWNEVLGESYDVAAKIVSLTELDAVSNLGANSIERARQRMLHYRTRVLAVDWGGGGEKQVSFTVAALLGFTDDGRIDVIWGKRLLTPHEHIREAAEIKYYWNIFKPHLLAHDYTGAGSLRETFLVQAGIPSHMIFPVQYIGPSRGGPCFHVAATEQHPRDHYRVDKSRTLLMTCAMIKCGMMRFFDKDYESPEDPGLIRDFLALYEEKTQTSAAGELYRIDSQDGQSDDFAQAVNIGATALWYRNKAWPNIAAMSHYTVTQEQLDAIAPATPDWELTVDEQEQP